MLYPDHGYPWATKYDCPGHWLVQNYQLTFSQLINAKLYSRLHCVIYTGELAIVEN